MDRAKLAAGIRLFLEAMGEDAARGDITSTPERVARAWAEEIVSGYGVDPESEVSWTPAEPASGLVMIRDIRFASVCVHHLLPFFGLAHVAYRPAGRLAGLSKIGRVVDVLSRRLQIQEHLTQRILETLDRTLAPQGVMVLLEAEHTCMTLRGVRKEGSRMVTLAASGILEKDREARREAIDLLTSGRRDLAPYR